MIHDIPYEILRVLYIKQPCSPIVEVIVYDPEYVEFRVQNVLVNGTTEELETIKHNAREDVYRTKPTREHIYKVIELYLLSRYKGNKIDMMSKQEIYEKFHDSLINHHVCIACKKELAPLGTQVDGPIML